MREPGLYALQVEGGREEHSRDLIRNIVPESLCGEVFVPRFEKSVRRKGKWRTELALLTPGYLYVRTPDVDAMAKVLRDVPAFTRLVRGAQHVVPLGEGDVAWMDALTSPGDRVVEMSRGLIEGDRIVVQDGPLRGRESSIVRIDRHKRLASLEFVIMGRNKLVHVGLEILRKI